MCQVDCLLHFTEHSKYVIEKVHRRLHVLARFSCTSCGARYENMALLLWTLLQLYSSIM